MNNYMIGYIGGIISLPTPRRWNFSIIVGNLIVFPSNIDAAS